MMLFFINRCRHIMGEFTCLPHAACGRILYLGKRKKPGSQKASGLFPFSEDVITQRLSGDFYKSNCNLSIILPQLQCN